MIGAALSVQQGDLCASFHLLRVRPAAATTAPLKALCR
jgi:hypothetical protein